MNASPRARAWSTAALVAGAALLLCRCGGGTGPTGGVGGTRAVTDPNMAAVIVDPGPPGANYTNGLFVTVRLCEPGSATNCQTLDHLLVDTGSVGVRVLESELRLSLPQISTGGLPVAECTPFVDGTAWGPVRVADVSVSGETAANLPVQVIGEEAFAMPSSCTGRPITTFAELSANGIFGVGVHQQDCGSPCALGATSGLYYTCGSTSGCTGAVVPVADQVANPVSAFPVDNNGTIIELPSIPSGGAPWASGVLIFGIDTQPNNALGGATVLPLGAQGFVRTTFPVDGAPAAYSAYLDTGSNGLFFLNTATTNLTQCTGALSSFYCPPTTTELSAVISSDNGAGTTVAFSVANASKLSGAAFALADLAGPMPGFPMDKRVPGFDWGLPFYFGRTVYTAIDNKETSGGPGPFFAF